MNFNKLKDFLDYYLPMLGVPGSDTVIYKNHEEIFRHRSGYDNVKYHTPVREDALYNIYSCTKVATVVAALQLIERGGILLNDPVHAYFPEYKNLTVKVKRPDGKYDVVPAKNSMLISHLFSMTSGLDYDLERPAIKSVYEATAGRCPTLDIVRALPKDPLLFDPGTHYCYSLSHDVLGGLVELVSGMKLGDYMRENIFEPLGMKDTTFDITPENYDRIAIQYAYDNVSRCGMEVPKDSNRYRFGTEYQSGGAGLLTTVDDYILLADALASRGVGKSGNRILSSRTVELMRTRFIPDAQNVEFSCGHNSGYDYCYGVRAMTRPAEIGSLVPEGVLGWDGAKLAIITVDPENKISVFHAEHMGALHGIVIPRFHNVLYSCLDED